MDTVSEAVVYQLARTKGWTRFVSVMFWIGGGFLILAGVIMFLVGLGSGSAMGGIDSLIGGAGFGTLMGGMYVVMAFFYAYPATKLGNFSSRVNDLIAEPTEANLIVAHSEQRQFWKYCGICMIVILSLYALIILVTIIVSVTSRLSV